MKSIRDAIGRELDWAQPSAMRREFELHDGNDVVARLNFRSALGSFATAETADGSWTFKRVGFWKPRVTVCVAGTDGEIATFQNDTWSAGGTLELRDGGVLRANTNFWMTQYNFSTEADEPLVRYRNLGGVLHLSARVEVTRAAAELAPLPWVVVLGWYLVIKMRDDGGGAAAAAAG